MAPIDPVPRKKETPVPYLPMDQHVSDVELLQVVLVAVYCCFGAVEVADVSDCLFFVQRKSSAR